MPETPDTPEPENELVPENVQPVENTSKKVTPTSIEDEVNRTIVDETSTPEAPTPVETVNDSVEDTSPETVEAVQPDTAVVIEEETADSVSTHIESEQVAEVASDHLSEEKCTDALEPAITTHSQITPIAEHAKDSESKPVTEPLQSDTAVVLEEVTPDSASTHIDSEQVAEVTSDDLVEEKCTDTPEPEPVAEPVQSAEDISRTVTDPSINPFIEGDEVSADEVDDGYSPNLKHAGPNKLVLCIIALIVIAGGAGGFMFMQQQKAATDTPMETAKEATSTPAVEEMSQQEATTPADTVESSPEVATAEETSNELTEATEAVEGATTDDADDSAETAVESTEDAIEGDAASGETPDALETEIEAAKATETEETSTNTPESTITIDSSGEQLEVE